MSFRLDGRSGWAQILQSEAAEPPPDAGPPGPGGTRGGPATAATTDWLSSESSVLVAESTHDWNNYAPDQSKVITHADYQYALFCADDLRLTLSRRNLQTDDVQLVALSERLSRTDDTHNNSVLGIGRSSGWSARECTGCALPQRRTTGASTAR